MKLFARERKLVERSARRLQRLHPALIYSMYYAYCLQHRSTKEMYYGYTEDLRRRLKEHQAEDKSWQLVYYEAYRSEIDARRRERKLKHYGQSRTHLKQRITNSLLE